MRARQGFEEGLGGPAFLRLERICDRTGEAKKNSQFTDYLGAEKEGGG